MSQIARDLLGNEASNLELAVLEVHQALASLAEREDAPPCIAASARSAQALTWQMVVDLDLDYRPGPGN